MFRPSLGTLFIRNVRDRNNPVVAAEFRSKVEARFRAKIAPMQLRKSTTAVAHALCYSIYMARGDSCVVSGVWCVLCVCHDIAVDIYFATAALWVDWCEPMVGVSQ